MHGGRSGIMMAMTTSGGRLWQLYFANVIVVGKHMRVYVLVDTLTRTHTHTCNALQVRASVFACVYCVPPAHNDKITALTTTKHNEREMRLNECVSE